MNRIVFVIFIGIFFTKAEAQPSALAIADSLYAIGNYSEAIKKYKNTDHLSPEVNQKIAAAYQTKGNLQEALQFYKKAIDQNPNLLISASRFGKLLYRTHRFQEADSLFSSLSKRFPKNPDFHYRLGLAKQKLKDSTFVQQFQKTVRLDSTHQKALYELARFQYRHHHYSEAEKLGKRALAAYADNAEMISLLGQNAYASEDYAVAAKRFEKLIELNHKSEFVYRKLGMSYYQLQDFPNAVKQFDQVIHLNPQNGEVHLRLGKVYNLMGKYQKGEKHLLMALLLAKNPVDEQYQALAMNYKMQEMYGKAIEYFKDALIENPHKMRSQYELAVCADNYYEAIETKINYYELFIRKFQKSANAGFFMKLAKNRLSDLKEERHLTTKKK